MAFLSDNYCFPFQMLMLFVGIVSAQLSSDHYSSTCPTVLSIVKTGVLNAVAKERRMGASLLRLHFHDCFVNGCDASILLDDTPSFTGEKTAAANVNSVRGFDVIDSIKSQVEKKCPGVVSCADILAIAARDSVVVMGGSSWAVQVGRRDSTTASLSAANSDIPSPGKDLSDLITAFTGKGFSAKEMVALSGAHSIGQARCTVFRDRVHNESNIESSFASSLKTNCPSSGLLHSDQQLYSGGTTDSAVTDYSSNLLSFSKDFASAMVKMGNMSPLTGASGQIRTNCWKIN
ncbi:peroxidase [Lithospermum erythrorhizon]|uniref:Peroxidase n=1 Tax=Lithospermum erythrorhizon TaxID=34254 RepID=A0AAV3NGZ6_LITER